MSVSGSIRRVTLDGVTFNAAFDANLAQTPPVLTEGVRHTGGVMMKKTLQTEQVESVTLVVTSSQNELLLELSKRTINFPMSYELGSGDVYRGVGQINLDNRETEENRRDVMLIPDLGWQPFLVE